MKGWRRRRGQQGEQIAAEFLQQQGYLIQERNYRSRRGEIDIIAWDGGTLVFIEVKSKTHTVFGFPAEMVDQRKQQTLVRVAMHYVRQQKLPHTALRFDVVAILVRPDAMPDVIHIPAAFCPSERFFY